MAITETHSPTLPELKAEIDIPAYIESAVVFGHADADGHLAAERTRDWLSQRELSVDIVVSSDTRNYRFWDKLSNFDLSEYDVVVFVDIAFRFRNPSESLARLLEVSDPQPQKRFVAIDHHPLLRPQTPRRNVQLCDVTDPYDCCLGVPDPELMQVAALCDGSHTMINPTPVLKKRALGVKRAAADVRGVAGDGLLMLIRERQWDFFEALADEDQELHRSARGVRIASNETSPLLEYARNHLSSENSK